MNIHYWINWIIYARLLCWIGWHTNFLMKRFLHLASFLSVYYSQETWIRYSKWWYNM